MQEVKKAVAEAILFEEEGERVYSQAAERASSDFVQNLFRGLAEDEARHAKIIRDYAASLEGVGGIDMEQELKSMRSNDPKRLFGVPSEEFSRLARIDEREGKPFMTGIELEKKSIEYYERMLREAEDEAGRKLFSFLIGQERMHLASLEKALDFLRNPADKFMEMEGWLLDGGV